MTGARLAIVASAVFARARVEDAAWGVNAFGCDDAATGIAIESSVVSAVFLALESAAVESERWVGWGCVSGRRGLRPAVNLP